MARRHLSSETLVLYDVSSSYMEGHCCPLATRGYSRDGRRGTLQIVYGLLCAPDGCPVAIEVFEGNTADPMTLAAQVDKLKRRFQLEHVVLVGGRGMITQARITEEITAAGLDLDHCAARACDQGAAGKRRVATVAVRPARHGLHHGTRVPRRASGGVPSEAW